MELKVAAGNFSLFVYEIVLSFSQLAEQHNIKLIYEGKDDGIHLWYDRFWMEKVLFNLLSNAFKNTGNSSPRIVSVRSANWDGIFIDNFMKAGITHLYE